MLTSNNIQYKIIEKKTGKVVNELNEEIYTSKIWDDLVRKHYPLENYLIQGYGIDVEEPLYEFLIRINYIQLT